MPELPEVETIRQAMDQALSQHKVQGIVLRRQDLRWPVTENLAQRITGQIIQAVSRRGKYLLIQFKHGTLIMHLGMSGSIRLFKTPAPSPKLHDHFDLIDEHILVRFNDPRRFGAILWTSDPIPTHPLLSQLGPEPLTTDFNGHYLFQMTRKRQANIKVTIMNSHIVVGIGNIYANEALFLAHIHPQRASNTLTLPECKILSRMIKQTLKKAILAGGTTLNDFYQTDGKPGYFRQKLLVYGKANTPCPRCHTPLINMVIHQRSSVICPICQQ